MLNSTKGTATIRAGEALQSTYVFAATHVGLVRGDPCWAGSGAITWPLVLDDKVSGLIGLIYENPWVGQSWRPILKGLAELTGSRAILLSAVDLSHKRILHDYWHGPDDAKFLDGLRDYTSDMYHFDPMLVYAARRPAAGVITRDRAAQIEALEDQKDYQSYLKWTRSDLGIGNGLVRYTTPSQGLTLGVSIHPSAAQGEHDPEKVRLFLMLFEHVNRAIRLASRKPDFERPEEAVLLVDGAGHVREASDSARAAVAANDGLGIEGGKLVTTCAADNAKLTALLRDAASAILTGGSGGAVAISRPSGRRDWLVFAGPSGPSGKPFGALLAPVLVRIVEPDASGPIRGPALWAQMFGLTPAEVRLALTYLHNDGNFSLTAARLGLLQATARVHLRNIFDKTGAHGQPALMRLLQRIEQHLPHS